MAEAPLIFYANEDRDSCALDLLYKHLFTLDVVPDRVMLHANRAGGHLQQVKMERLIILLVSVDSLVILKGHGGILTQMMRHRKQRFGLTGIISVLCRPCAWETLLKETLICSGPNGVPIASGKIDQACLSVAREIKSYMLRWDRAIEGASVDLEALYGPAGVGDYSAGDTISYGKGDGVGTGKVIYVKANGIYVVHVEGRDDHHMVSPCDVIVIERR